MSNITPTLNEFLQKHNTHCNQHPLTRSSTRDEFLKEAYRINSHILSLHTYLLSIRQAYLSTSHPPRRAAHPPSSRLRNGPSQETTYLSASARDAIDASSKTVLRDLNASIRQLASAEEIRRDTESRVSSKKYAKGVLGRWAAGASGGDKSPEQVVEEARREVLATHRDSVLWYLGRELEGVGEVQRAMMERRLEREVERGRSVLYKVKGSVGAGEGLEGVGMSGGGGEGMDGRAGKEKSEYRGGGGVVEDESRREIEQQLSPEQLQLFARENQDMLKQYEDTLDQVRTAERSMLEISELQTSLVQNLDVQTANISQLVSDSFSTTENVGSGNKELKKATERKSTARMVFWASCGLCGFLVTWDLIF
ncbi:hypothetical protein HO173_007160 [Letharia columbiana]|uniref:SNARE-complex protein Syntaxin-18 N-terminal domain-containing protein n=1 Tax=Letharia columbiana TaxID=112416 RepID=A0A8H6L3W7_9LECA|nr:uncharacterized protein HO173_007160 [Letharia columbiana]KAF6234535.1 hypothetical protein HO173_007160 [Letharia columbiana]